LILILSKPPYGSEDVISMLFIALAAVSRGIKTTIILIDDGVYTALRDQRPEGLKYPSVEDLIYLIITDAEIFVHEDSLKERGISGEDLIEGVNVSSDDEIVEVLLTKTGAFLLC